MELQRKELFRNKGSIYALDEATKEWTHRGVSGIVFMLQSSIDPDDVRIKFQGGKNDVIIWWRLTSSKLKPKGERALVLKAWAVQQNQQEILAMRFSDQMAAISFAKKYHSIFPKAVQDAEKIDNIFKKGGSNPNLHDANKNIENGNRRNGKSKPNGASDSIASLPDLERNQYNGYDNNFAANHYQLRNHRMSGPPPAPSRHKKQPPPPRNDDDAHYGLFDEDDDQQINMARHYSEPLPVQPQINHQKRMVKASPDMRPPTFVREAEEEEEEQLQNGGASWKCAVCTYQNQESSDKCSMCGLNKKEKKKENNDDVDKDKDSNKWQCSACTFNNHGWMDRCEVCSAKRRAAEEVAGNDLIQNKDDAILLHNVMRDQIEFEYEDEVGSPAVYNEIPEKSQFPFIDNYQPKWNCPICTLLNIGTNVTCEACNTDRNGSVVVKQKQNNEYKDQSYNEYEDSSFNEYGSGSFRPQPQPEWDNHWERMMHTGMGVIGNPFNLKNMNLQYDIAESMASAHSMYAGAGAELDEYGYFESTVEDFSRAASDIACYNNAPSSVFSTLRSVAKKLLKEDLRYRTLDTTNPKVMERLIGFEGVLDFLMLLGFESDAMGMKLICQIKPSRAKVNNAISVLNSYQQRFRMTDNGGGGADQLDDNDVPNLNAIFIGGGDSDEEEEDAFVGKRTRGGNVNDLVNCAPEKKNDILTLEQIILWSTHENMQDNDTMETLVMTHKLFTDSLTLLKQLRIRFFVPIPKDVVNVCEFQNGVQKRIQLKVIKALRDWMKHYWFEDFAPMKDVISELCQWLEELSSCGSDSEMNAACPWIFKLYEAVRKEYQRLSQIDWEAILLAKLDIFAPYADVDLGDSSKYGAILAKCTSEEIADQITLMDYKLFSSIEPRECVHQRWKDSKNKREAPNILSLIQQFNNFTIFIQIQILKERSLKKRATAIKRIVKMGQHFKVTRNYNSLCAVFSALNSAPIHRLKIAWNRVQEKTRIAFQEWSIIFCRDFNHRNLRQLLRKAGGNPCIPHIGVFLQDLVFIDEGNKKKVEIEAFSGKKLLNFNKCVRIADRIKNLQLFQNHKYQHEHKQQLQKLLLIEFDKLKNTTEDQIWEMSTKVKQDDAREAKQPLGFFNAFKDDKDDAPNPIPPPAPNSEFEMEFELQANNVAIDDNNPLI